MIVLAAGMPKSGTAWLFNLVNDLVVDCGGVDARTARERFALDFLEGNNCNVGALTPDTLGRLQDLHESGALFAVKTHAPPGEPITELLRQDVFRVLVSFRDPRDAMLSAYEHGHRSRLAGSDQDFAQLDDLDKAQLTMRRWIREVESWLDLPRVLPVRYEDLLRDPVRQMQDVARFLGLECPEDRLAAILRNQDPRTREVQGLPDQHFHRGVAGRHRELPEERREACTETFLGFLMSHYPERTGPALAETLDLVTKRVRCLEASQDRARRRRRRSRTRLALLAGGAILWGAWVTKELL